MVCLLCLNDSKEFITIFNDLGLQYNVEEVIKKHFWIVPKESDSDYNTICVSCWFKVNAFHTFYVSVEEIHKTKWNNVVALPEDVGSLPVSSFKVEIDSEHLEPSINFVAANEEVGEDISSNSDLIIDIDSNYSATISHGSETVSSVEDEEDSNSDFNAYNRRRASLRSRSTPSEQNKTKEVSTDSLEKENGKDEDFVKKEPRRRGRPKKGETVVKKKQIAHPTADERRLLSKKYDELIAEHINLTCNLCNKALEDFPALKKHYRSLHNERGYASCCNKKFLKRGVLVDHIHLHLNPEHFKCKECEKVLADRRCLEMHMLTHQSDKCKIYQCDECPKKFQKRSVLNRHKTTHIPEEKWKHKCDDCDKLFPSDYALKAHVNNVHARVYAKICDICGKSIRAGKTALKQHLLQHEGISLPNFQCDKCGVKLRNKYSLKRHITAMHAEHNITEVCKICGKISPNAHALKRHYYYVHQCQRKYKCTICEKAFKKPNTLKEHMTTHTGEVLYTCPHCPKTFNSSANMHSHRKKAHRTEWELNRKIKRPLLGTTKKTETVEDKKIEKFEDL